MQRESHVKMIGFLRDLIYDNCPHFFEVEVVLYDKESKRKRT